MTGQPSISDLAMKETSTSDASTSMSVQEIWLDAISSGRFRSARPTVDAQAQRPDVDPVPEAAERGSR